MAISTPRSNRKKGKGTASDPHRVSFFPLDGISLYLANADIYSITFGM
jgi:hypothetical protein